MQWFQGRRVLVPFDFSDDSVEAVKVALTLAEKSEEVHILHVLVDLPPTDPIVTWDDFTQERRREKTFDLIRSRLRDVPIENAQINVALGNPASVIADMVDEIGAGLVVIPSHGHTGIKRFFLGSVAEHVVRLAKCPILVLKKTEKHS